MKKKFDVFLFFSALFLAGLLPAGNAADSAANDPLQGQFGEIKTRLEAVEKSQQELSAKDDKIIEELDRLRVWVHRK